MVRPGAAVNLVFYDEGRAHIVGSEISSLKPFTLSSTDPHTALLKEGRRVMMIFQREGRFARAEAEVRAATQDEQAWRVEALHYGWEEVDRRRYPRYMASVVLSLRAVAEREGQIRFSCFEVQTEDLSLGGAWVATSNPLPAGSLVEVEAVLRPGEHVRILALVVRSSDTGMALDFLDYIGASRYYLHAFLNRLV